VRKCLLLGLEGPVSSQRGKGEGWCIRPQEGSSRWWERPSTRRGGEKGGGKGKRGVFRGPARSNWGKKERGGSFCDGRKKKMSFTEGEEKKKKRKSGRLGGTNKEGREEFAVARRKKGRDPRAVQGKKEEDSIEEATTLLKRGGKELCHPTEKKKKATTPRPRRQGKEREGKKGASDLEGVKKYQRGGGRKKIGYLVPP